MSPTQSARSSWSFARSKAKFMLASVAKTLQSQRHRSSVTAYQRSASSHKEKKCAQQCLDGNRANSQHCADCFSRQTEATEPSIRYRLQCEGKRRVLGHPEISEFPTRNPGIFLTRKLSRYARLSKPIAFRVRRTPCDSQCQKCHFGPREDLRRCEDVEMDPEA